MLRKIRYPILFQGKLNKKHYFEGWYYKQVSKDEKRVISFIPGISLVDNDQHSFVQYIYISLNENNKKTMHTGYVKYPLNTFKYFNSPFMIQVGENIFSEAIASIKVIDDKMNIQGTLKFGPFIPIEKSIFMPNIMGFFAYMPKMECYHGVISMAHRVNGILNINGTEIDLSDGKGYIEKDWGTSFPKEYIWIQCNNFKNETTSIFCSIANIPFMGKSFRGHICNLSLDGKEYRFATYKGSKLKIENITNENIRIVLENQQVVLKIEATLEQIGELIAPQKGKMQKIIKEGLSGEVRIYLYNKESRISYEDLGRMAGIEIVGF